MAVLSGKTVLIVGASSGIGLATARQAGDLGAHVVMASRSLEKLEAGAENVSGSRELFALNMLDEAAITRLVSSLNNS